MGDVPEQYRDAPLVSAVFDFQDLANRLGYINYYGIGFLTGGSISAVTAPTKTFSLVTLTNIFPEFDDWGGDPPSGLGDRTTKTGVTPETFNFDTGKFNYALQAKGTAFVNFAISNEQGGSNAVTVSVKLQKVDSAGNATDLTATVTRSFPGVDTLTENNIAMALPITDPTMIGIDEKIREAITITCGDAGDTMTLWHNPTSFDSISNTRASTQMKLLMPFSIDS